MGLNLKKLGSKLWDQVNPLDNNRTFVNQAPTNNRGVGNVLGSGARQVVRPFTETADLARNLGQYGAGAFTGNPQVRNNAFEQARESFRQSLPGGFYRPLEILGATAGTSLAINKLAGQPAYRGVDLTTPLDEQLQGIGLSSRTSGPTAARKIIGAGGETAFNLATLGATGQAAKQGLKQVVKTSGSSALRYGPVTGVFQTAQEDKPTLKSFGKNVATSTAVAGGLPLVAGVAGNTLRAAPKVVAKAGQGLDTPEIVQLKAQKATSIKAMDNASPKMMQQYVKNVNNIDKQIQAIQEGGYAQLPGGKPKVAAKPLEALPEAKLPTGLAKGPNMLQKTFTSVRGELSRLGTGGKEAAQRLQNMRATAETGQAGFFKAVPTVTKLGRKEFPQFVDSLDALSRGETPAMSPKISQAVNEWTQAIPKIRQTAQQVGVDVGDLGQNYFPRQYSELLKSRDGFNSAVNHLVQTGQAPDAATAIQQLQFMKREFSKPFGNLEHARNFDMPGYDKSQKALVNYVKGAYERIAKAEQFGPKGEVGNQLVVRMAQEGYDGSRATRNLKIGLGEMEYNPTSEAVSGKVRQVNGLMRLGTAAISNSTQSLNTATVSGLWNTAKSAIKILNPEERQLIKDSGVVLDSVLKQVREQATMTKGLSSHVAAPLFGTVEKFNRLVAGEAGKNWATKLAAKGDAKSLAILREKLGVQGKIGKTLTREQEIQATRGLVERTQFKVDPQDLPGWVDSPQGKLVAQFRNFGYKQTGFIFNDVLKEATKGNLKPLLRFIAVGVPAGFAAGSVKGAVKGQAFQTLKGPEDQDASLAQTIGQSLQQVGGFGLPGDAKFLFDKRKSERLPQYVAGTVAGPTAGTAVETVINTAKANAGKPQELGRQGLKAIPVVGPKISNTILPYQSATTTAKVPKSGEEPTTAFLNKQASVEKKQLETSTKPGDYSLRQLSNNKYAAVIDGKIREFDNLDDARMASRKDKFDKSDAKAKVIGDTYFYKSKDGKVHTKPKVLYDFEQSDAKANLDMDRAYEAKDLNKWVGLAKQKYDALEKKKGLYDPETEQDEIDKITLQQENLQQKAEKYLAKGINGSGGSSGSKKRVETAGSIYKYAVSPTAGGKSVRPTVTIRQGGGGRARVARRGGGLPKVSSRKSLV